MKIKVETRDLMPSSHEFGDKTLFINCDYNLAIMLSQKYLENNKKWIKSKTQFYRDIGFAYYYPKLMKDDKAIIRTYLSNNHFFVHDLSSIDTFSQVDQFTSYDNIVIFDPIQTKHDLSSLESVYRLVEMVKTIAKNGQRLYYISHEYNFDPKLECVYDADSVANNVDLPMFLTQQGYLDHLFMYINRYNRLPLYRLTIPYFANLFIENGIIQKDTLYTLQKFDQYQIPLEYWVYVKEVLDYKISFLSTDKLCELIYDLFFIQKAKSQNYLIDSDMKFSLVNLHLHSAKRESKTLKVESNFDKHYSFQDHSYEEYIDGIAYCREQNAKMRRYGERKRLKKLEESKE